MTHVLRRTTPRHNGTRYYAALASVASNPDHAKQFDTVAEAEQARATLREPHLWEALPIAAAAALDAKAAETLRASMRERPNRAARMLLALGVASGMALPGRSR